MAVFRERPGLGWTLFCCFLPLQCFVMVSEVSCNKQIIKERNSNANRVNHHAQGACMFCFTFELTTEILAIIKGMMSL